MLSLSGRADERVGYEMIASLHRTPGHMLMLHELKQPPANEHTDSVRQVLAGC